MNNSIQNFASQCVAQYATYDKIDDCYHLNVLFLPEFIRHKFAELIMEKYPSYAAEATGPDNKLWGTVMLPTLLKFLKNYQDSDFQETWRNCLTSYFLDFMQEEIDEALHEFNSDYEYTKPFHQTYGVRAHGAI